MYIALAILLIVLAVFFWLTNFVGLPGNWLNLIAVLLFILATPAELLVAVSWIAFGVLAFLALLGEVLETALSALAASKVGGSKRSAALAILGSIAGGIVGGVVGVFLPIPVIGALIGPVIGAILVGGLGAFGGAVLGEKWKGRDTNESVEVGKAAFLGRIFGSLGKAAAGFAMILVQIAAHCISGF